MEAKADVTGCVMVKVKSVLACEDKVVVTDWLNQPHMFVRLFLRFPKLHEQAQGQHIY